MLYEPFRVSYARTEPPPRKRGFARFLCELAVDTRADLARIADFSRTQLEKARGSLGSRGAVGLSAASLGLFAGMLLMHEPAPPVSAHAPLPAASAIAAEDVMCSAPPVANAEVVHAAAPKPSAVERAPQVKRAITLGGDVRAKPIRLAKAKPTRPAKAAAPSSVGSPARQRSLAEEAGRAERAELASAALARRTHARP